MATLPTHQGDKLEERIDQVANAIRGVFAVEGDLDEKDVEEIHTLLVNCTESANSRLKQCDDLLRQGLKQEAVQECERAPHLLDMVTALDLPEWQAWSDYVRQFGIPPQPDLLLDVANSLNDAYTSVSGLDKLLRLHRLLAIARSPLKQRLDVLRALARQDPDNQLWTEDLADYESARLQEISVDMQSLFKQGNLHGIAELKSEVESASWATAPPVNIIDTVAESHCKLRRSHARRELTSLVHEIDSAFSSFDLQSMDLFFTRWQELSVIAELDSNDELTRQVQQAFGWRQQEIDEHSRQESFRRSLVELETALDEDSTGATELERLFSAASRFDDSIPERLQTRYRLRIQQLETTGKRRFYGIVVGVVALLLLIGTGVAFAVRAQVQAKAVDEMILLLEQAADADRDAWDNALEAYRSQSSNSSIATHPQIVSLANNLDGLVAKDIRRAASLADTLSEIRQQLAENPTWTMIDEIKNRLDKQADRVKADGEKEELEALRGEWFLHHDRYQSKQNNKFEDRVKPLQLAIEKLQSLTRKEVLEAIGLAKELKNFPRVSTDIRHAQALTQKLERLNSRLKELDKQQQIDWLLERVLNATGDISAYKRELRAYASSEPLGNRSRDFNRVLAEDIAILEAVDSWQEVVLKWNSLEYSESNLTARLRLVELIKKNYQHYPGSQEVIALEPHINAQQKRKKAIAQILFLLDEPWMKLDWIHDSKTGKSYYFNQPPELRESSTGSKWYVKALMNEKDGTTKTIRIAEGNATKPQQSPQKAYLVALQKKFVKPITDFEILACRILKTIASDKNLDPVIKVRMLQVLVDNFRKCSVVLKQALEPVGLVLDNLDADSANAWPDKKNPKTIEKINEFAAPINDLNQSTGIVSLHVIETTAVKPAIQKIRKSRPKLPVVNWSGVLMKKGNGEWAVESIRKNISPNPSSPTVQILNDRLSDNGVLIGLDKPKELENDIKSDVKIIVERDLENAREGRPVFYME